MTARQPGDNASNQVAKAQNRMQEMKYIAIWSE